MDFTRSKPEQYVCGRSRIRERCGLRSRYDVGNNDLDIYDIGNNTTTNVGTTVVQNFKEDMCSR